MGELTVSERQAIETMLHEDAELKKRLQSMEADFERIAFENAISPDARVKESLKARIEDEKSKPAFTWPLFVAASLALLFLCTTFWLYTQWQNTQKDLDALVPVTTDLEERLNLLEQKSEVSESKLNLVTGTHTLPFLLQGNSKLPNARAVAFVNHNERIVMVNAKGLPELPEDQTYQMWSDVEGEMINMGLLSPKAELVSLKYIDKAESLNITIEPAGGNDHPTVEKLISNVIL